MNDLVKVGIVGGKSPAAGELLRLLVNHPAVDIAFVYCEEYAGDAVTELHHGLYGETQLHFTDRLPFEEVDMVFLCCNDGQSTRFLNKHYIPADVRILDLSGDYRLSNDDNDFVYGLPELNALQLQGAQHVANPSCLATCTELALLPLAAEGWLDGDIVVNAIMGTTADELGVAAGDFAWNQGNISIFDALSHPHLPEIRQSLQRLQPSFEAALDLIPYQGDFTRGIFATALTRCDASEEDIVHAYKDFYEEATFTHYVNQPIDLKQAVNTNKCLIHIEKHGDKVLISAALDNLLKGAAGQAVQNMNLMFELEETTGLRLKASAF